MSQPLTPYVLVVGHGRSGTNWLLDMLDASPETHCRNEPNEVKGSVLEYIQELWFSGDALQTIQKDWEENVALAKVSMSERDHRITHPKRHIYKFSAALNLTTATHSARARKILSAFLPEFRQGEWPVPLWLSKHETLAESCAVFKINMLTADFINWHTQKYPSLPILHIVRHPCGYLNSSIQRFFSKLSSPAKNQEHTMYQAMLKTAIQKSMKWQGIVKNIESMSLIETLAWYWRVNNESIYNSNKHQSNYKILIYEEMVSSPLEIAKEIYAFCRLEWKDSTEKIISNELNQSVWGELSTSPKQVAKAWETKLDKKHQDLIQNQVLAGSSLQKLWEA